MNDAPGAAVRFGAALRRALGVLVALVIVLALLLRQDARGLFLVVRAANLHGVIRQVADADAVAVRERLERIPTQAGHLDARIYEPTGAARQAVLLVSGLNPEGFDEARLRWFARTLAESRVVVVTPAIPELARYDITGAITDQIEQASLWLAVESGLAPRGRIGIIGISFSGGLALVAAARPSLRERLLYVLSFGGHDDLGRVLEYYCAGLEAGGWSADPQRMPHDYGAAIVLHTLADRLVPPDQVHELRGAMRRYLQASYLERTDVTTARQEQAALRALADRLPEPSATLLRSVNDRHVARLGPWLRPHIGPYAANPALSPALAPLPSAPVFLLHGRDDSVIPADESIRLAARLRGRVEVELLLTDVISHADADRQARLSDVLRLARFWGDLLAR